MYVSVHQRWFGAQEMMATIASLVRDELLPRMRWWSMNVVWLMILLRCGWGCHNRALLGIAFSGMGLSPVRELGCQMLCRERRPFWPDKYADAAMCHDLSDRNQSPFCMQSHSSRFHPN